MTTDKKILIFLLIIVGIPLIFWGLMTQHSFRLWICQVTKNYYCYEVFPLMSDEEKRKSDEYAKEHGVNF